MRSHIILEGRIYLVKCGDSDYYKIGITGMGGDARLKSMQTNCPYKLEVVHEVYSKDPYEVEWRIHEKFQDHQVRGEWYEFCSLEVEHVKSIMDGMSSEMRKSNYVRKVAQIADNIWRDYGFEIDKVEI